MEEFLTKEVIEEIQNYLMAMEWSQNDYRVDQLQLFLKGVTYALYDKGTTFNLVKEPDEKDRYYTHYAVDMFVYENPTDCWSDKKLVCRIYSNKVEIIKN